jgi:hypothetical protein
MKGLWLGLLEFYPEIETAADSLDHDSCSFVKQPQKMRKHSLSDETIVLGCDFSLLNCLHFFQSVQLERLP